MFKYKNIRKKSIALLYKYLDNLIRIIPTPEIYMYNMSIYACLPRKDQWRQEGVPVNPPPPTPVRFFTNITHTHEYHNNNIVQYNNNICGGYNSTTVYLSKAYHVMTSPLNVTAPRHTLFTMAGRFIPVDGWYNVRRVPIRYVCISYEGISSYIVCRHNYNTQHNDMIL